MSAIRIYGHKGMILAKPFQVNSVDDDPEPIGEEKQIINYLNVSDSDNQEESEVATDTGSQGQ